MNTILTLLIDLLGEVFLIAGTTPASGHSMVTQPRSPWWRRLLGMALFVLLAALPFLLLFWLGN
ncbi:MAG: hypothetical protein KDN20_08435 [Verrucomicrobiae bacterium]|nr:hypothetical protein [Verrucomicrobiae bacterium]